MAKMINFVIYITIKKINVTIFLGIKKKKKVSTEKKEGSAKYWEKRFPEKLRRLNL